MSKLLDIRKRIEKKKRQRKYNKNKDTFEIRDNRETEFFIVNNVFVDKFMKVCGIHASCVYFALCRHANNIDQTCFPSIDLISDMLKMSSKSVAKGIRILEWHNIIKVDRVIGQPNIYILLNKKHWKKFKVIGTGIVCKGPGTEPEGMTAQNIGPSKQLKRNR